MKLTYRLTNAFCLTGVAIVMFAAMQSARGDRLAAATETSSDQAEARVLVQYSDESSLEVSVETPTPTMELMNTPIGAFVQVKWPGAALRGESGAPKIPVVAKVFIAPRGAEITADVRLGPATLIDLAEAGYDAPLMPMQTAIPELGDYGATTPFEYDSVAYAADADAPTMRVAVQEMGVVRGRQLYRLEVRPLAYNAARGVLTFWPDIDVSLTFTGGQTEDSADMPRWRPLSDVLLNPPAMNAGRGAENYLIVAPPLFASSAPVTQFAAAKTVVGYNVSIYEVPSGSTNTQIKAYIEGLWGTPDAPDYILIVGDTDCLDGSIVPSNYDSIPNFRGDGNRHGATDLYYACMDGGSDWYPDIAIGRFPAQTLTQLQAMVDKTLFVMNGVFSDPGYLTTAAFVAGMDYDCGDREAHDYVMDTHLDAEGFSYHKLYSTLGSTTQDMHDAFNDGCLYVVYYGHSDFVSWWDPPYTLDDINGGSLHNADGYPFIFSFTCRTAGFDYPTECVGEAWMRGVNKGAVTFLGATRMTHWYTGKWIEVFFLETKLFDVLYYDEIREVGPAWQATMVEFMAENFGAPFELDYSEIFNVLGDPSLRIAEEASFSLSADPPTDSICSSPVDTAEYDVEVTPGPGFDLDVHLSVSGLPVGATADFSINDAEPPFVSVLSITTDQAGTHNITITGAAVSGPPQFTSVNLEVSTSSPVDPMVLTAPGDETTDALLKPTLEWQAVAEATEYDVEIALDENFTTIVDSATTPDTSYEVVDALGNGVTYFWRCRAVNICGGGDYPQPFQFTTYTDPRYLTEEFDGGTFDIENTTTEFTPDGSGFYYAMCSSTAAELPTDPTGGIVLPLGNDDSLPVTPSQSISLFGEDYSSFQVNANGNITFGVSDNIYNETITAHMSKPRIAGVFDDLDLRSSGTVSWKELADRVAVTYEDAPLYGSSDTVTFQVEIFFDESIHITWLTVQSSSCIVGLSNGAGVPFDYEDMDLSAAEGCGPSCIGDFTGDGLRNLNDLALLLGYYGQTGLTHEQGDTNGDGACNLDDLAYLLGVYGVPCP